MNCLTKGQKRQHSFMWRLESFNYRRCWKRQWSRTMWAMRMDQTELLLLYRWTNCSPIQQFNSYGEGHSLGNCNMHPHTLNVNTPANCYTGRAGGNTSHPPAVRVRRFNPGKLSCILKPLWTRTCRGNGLTMYSSITKILLEFALEIPKRHSWAFNTSKQLITQTVV